MRMGSAGADAIAGMMTRLGARRLGSVSGVVGGPLAYVVKGSTVYRVLTDQLGSPRDLIDTATGTVAEAITYDAWGNVLVDTAPGLQPLGFAGGLYDAGTGLVRFGARDYNAASGRWVSRDPLKYIRGSETQYAYVGNDPVNDVDSTGLDTDDCIRTCGDIANFDLTECKAFCDIQYFGMPNSASKCKESCFPGVEAQLKTCLGSPPGMGEPPRLEAKP